MNHSSDGFSVLGDDAAFAAIPGGAQVRVAMRNNCWYAFTERYGFPPSKRVKLSVQPGDRVLTDGRVEFSENRSDVKVEGSPTVILVVRKSQVGGNNAATITQLFLCEGGVAIEAFNAALLEVHMPPERHLRGADGFDPALLMPVFCNPLVAAPAAPAAP